MTHLSVESGKPALILETLLLLMLIDVDVVVDVVVVKPINDVYVLW